ncbi:hypothetical protein EZV62_002500 [Acer yangbiense]|uniref:RBR-type E3 ubiquitin transferase n=1 Tax=Acer yangbiense TaxID=1000413 RepID=A0A5C7IXC6_9ROSI|nr:hypothetical protein EZV62_002500 [Acer yangbiense]
MATTVVNDADPADDLQFLLAEQRAELTAAQSLESDLDFANKLSTASYLVHLISLLLELWHYISITGRWPPKQRKIAVLVNQVHLLRCNPVLVSRNDLKYGLKLARDAIVCQITLPAELSHAIIMIETCVICLEDTDVGNMFSVDGCLHRYCFSCMKLHVENKLLHAMVPIILLERLKQCIREASIPAMERVYCPYPKCSALMTRNQVSKSAKNGFVGQGLFCINCKVPWHKDMTCLEYKRLNPNPLQRM